MAIKEFIKTNGEVMEEPKMNNNDTFYKTIENEIYDITDEKGHKFTLYFDIVQEFWEDGEPVEYDGGAHHYHIENFCVNCYESCDNADILEYSMLDDSYISECMDDVPTIEIIYEYIGRAFYHNTRDLDWSNEQSVA